MTWALARLSSLDGGSCQSPVPAAPSASRAARPCRAGWPPRAARARLDASSGRGRRSRRRPGAPRPRQVTASAGPSPRPATATAAIDGWRPSARARPNGSVGSSSQHRPPSSPAGPVAPGGADQPPDGPGQAEAAVRTDTPVNTRMPTAATTSRTTAAPKPPSAVPSGSAHGRPHPPPGRRQVVRGGAERRRPTGQRGQTRHRQEHQGAADDGPGRLPTRRSAAPSVASSSPRPMSMRMPMAIRTGGTQEPPQPSRSPIAEPGIVAGRTRAEPP